MRVCFQSNRHVAVGRIKKGQIHHIIPAGVGPANSHPGLAQMKLVVHAVAVRTLCIVLTVGTVCSVEHLCQWRLQRLGHMREWLNNLFFVENRRGH